MRQDLEEEEEEEEGLCKADAVNEEDPEDFAAGSGRIRRSLFTVSLSRARALSLALSLSRSLALALSPSLARSLALSLSFQRYRYWVGHRA